MSRSRTALQAAAASVAVGLALASCAAGPAAQGGPSTGGDAALRIATSFYPIEYAAQQIGGTRVSVSVLTKPGTEPHDLELSAKDAADLRTDDLLLYAKGFQPAVDSAAGLLEPGKVLDVSAAARLTLAAGPDGTEQPATAQPTAARDPHFWLDPERYAAVARLVGERLAKADPAGAQAYQRATTAFVAKLDALDAELTRGLARCSVRDLVTSHAAFGYLAQRHGFTQHGIAGLSPGAEPSAGALARLTDLVRSRHVTTIYQETLVQPQFAQTVAASTGAKVATLDPIEGITTASAGSDYFEVMRANLAALRAGQQCR